MRSASRRSAPNLIEFKLTGSPGAGLGARLDRIMNNFLETYRQVAPQRAGARLVLIDPPKDPERPVAGRSLTALIGMAAGLVLGLTLALAAEAMDRRVRSEADLRRIPDMPPVLRLPRLTAPTERRTAEPPVRRRLARAAAPVLLALVAILGLNHYNLPPERAMSSTGCARRRCPKPPDRWRLALAKRLRRRRNRR